MSEVNKAMDVVEKATQVFKHVALALEKTLPPLRQAMNPKPSAPVKSKGNKKVTKEGGSQPKADEASA